MSLPANPLSGVINTEHGEIPVLGFIVFWGVQNVECTRDWLRDKLDSVGLNGERYAKIHNYRNTLVRCLGSLEEQRIIRRVKETPQELIYQFTSENLVELVGETPRLEYTLETTVIIDKQSYAIEENFATAIAKCDERLRPILISMFEKERHTYRSNDITRYVKRIFDDYADIVPLRQQGSVYFVPAAYKKIIEQVSDVLTAIPVGKANMECVPVPDVESARLLVKNAVETEVVEIFSKMEDEIIKMQNSPNEITDKWVEYRIDRIAKIKGRLEIYTEALGDAASKLHGKFDALKATLKTRKLEV